MSPASESHGPFPCHLSAARVSSTIRRRPVVFRSSLLPSGSRSSDKFVNEYRVVQIHTYIRTISFSCTDVNYHGFHGARRSKRADGEKKKSEEVTGSWRRAGFHVVIASCVYSVPSSRLSLALKRWSPR